MGFVCEKDFKPIHRQGTFIGKTMSGIGVVVLTHHCGGEIGLFVYV